jgi:hypothetical protein
MYDRRTGGQDGRELWPAARTLDDLGDLMARWLEGEIGYQPGYGGGPENETAGLVTVLAAVNRAGFMTDFSQPGVPLVAGSGQRAAVSGFCPESLVCRLRRAALGTDLVVLDFPPGLDVGAQIVVTVSAGEECTWIGVPLDGGNMDYIYGGDLQPEGLLALHLAHQVQIFDPVWGRNDLLWDFLAAGVVASPDARPSS